MTPPRGGRDVSRQQRSEAVSCPPGFKRQAPIETVATLTPMTLFYMDALRTHCEKVLLWTLQRQISRPVYRWVWGLLTLWSEEDRTWAGSMRAPSPGSRVQAGPWGSSGSNTGRSHTAQQPLRPASPRQTQPGARGSPAWHSSWSGEQGYRQV